MPQRFDHVRRSVKIGTILAVIGITALAVASGYSFLNESDPKFEAYLLGIALLAGAFFLAALLVHFANILNLLLKIEADAFRSYDVLRDIHQSLEKQEGALQIICENAQLSDAVRAVTHRTRERTALRLAINEEIIRGDWEAAYALVEQLESRHGYLNESARLREEVDQSRDRETRTKLHEAVEAVRQHMADHDWDRARRELHRLMAAHPDDEEVGELPRRFAQLRNDHKRRLLKAWDETVQRNEVDRGIAILKELDQYLTPNEAAALAESARGVFRAKLHNLGVQFSLAVTEQNWLEAYRVGQQITTEFPNSRMAQEVKERAHILARRAGEAEGEPIAANASQD